MAKVKENMEYISEEVREFDIPTPRELVIGLISRNTHNGNGGITIYDLEKKTGVVAPTIRNIIASARKKGLPIISTGRKYKFGNKQEIEEQINRLVKRAKNFLQSANGLLKGNEEHYYVVKDTI